MGFFDRFFKPTKEDISNSINSGDSSIEKNENLNESFAGYGGFNAAVGSFGNPGAPGFNLGDSYGLEGNFIGDSFYDTGGVFGRPFGAPGLAEVEKSYIMHQRMISLYPEVAIGIEEIMRDLFNHQDPFVLQVDNPDEIEFDQVNELFEQFRSQPFTVISKSKVPSSLIVFNFLKQAYIDGRICIMTLKVNPDKIFQKGDETPKNKVDKRHKNKNRKTKRSERLQESLVHFNNNFSLVDYNKIKETDIKYLIESSNELLGSESKQNSSNSGNSNSTNEIRLFIPIDPLRLQESEGKMYYSSTRANKTELSEDQLIQGDFGLFDVVGARHGFLLYAFKYANQLQSLQDMLIPMRFRRSVARRVFNVDISSLPQSRAVSYMQDLQNKFKYKKHYDATSGKIVSKTNEPTGIVEDYWFANRSGNKGTTVETIDEAGNFQDSLDDIMYFNKKLYQSMFIPLRRIFESDASYDYTANSIEVDELRFVTFLDRVRFVFNTVLTEMFQQILKDKGFSDDVISGVTVDLNYEAWYEKAKVKEDFEKGLDLYETAKPYIGKLFSAETVIQKVFDMSASDIKDEFDKIKGELEEDSVYYPIYQANDTSEDDY